MEIITFKASFYLSFIQILYLKFVCFGDRFLEDQIDKFEIHFVPQNPSIGHRILHREPYLVPRPQVAHPCNITFSYAILLARGMCDDLKFATSLQRPEKIFNNLVGHCTTPLLLFCCRLKIKWESFFYIETT